MVCEYQLKVSRVAGKESLIVYTDKMLLGSSSDSPERPAASKKTWEGLLLEQRSTGHI